VLRLILARDGGTISSKVADKDGNPVPNCNVLIIPAGASSESSIADGLILGQTDQNGTYSSEMLAPGKYHVLATNVSIDKTPERIRQVTILRSRGQEIEIVQNSPASALLSPISID
jgi:hypothetical protein